MLVLFSLIFIVAVGSLSHILKRDLPQSSYVLTDLVSLWTLASIASIIFTVLTLQNLDIVIFVGIFSIIALTMALVSRREWAHRMIVLRQFWERTTFVAPILLLVGIIVYTILFAQHSVRWGSWDAWTIWNLHAKFMYFSADFQQMYLEPIYTGQDYPLLLPSLIATFWKLTSATSPMIPIIVSFTITLSAILIGYSALAQRSKLFALMLLTVMVGNQLFVRQGAYQYADTLLGMYLLVVIVLMYQISGKTNSLQYILIGFIAASLGWVKNEGLLLFIITSVIFAIRNLRSFKSIILYAVGALLPLAMAMYYKFAMAPSNDFLSQLSLEHIIGRLSMFPRYYTIGEYFIINVLVAHHIPVLLLIVALFVFRAYQLSYQGASIILIAISYFMVYVITQTDLMWNLGTSATRLFQQLFPALMYVLFMGLGKSEHPWMAKLNKANNRL